MGAASVAAAEPEAVAKVVVIVGPSGAATDRYRSEARAAAKLARRYTPDVTELYSPDATWPAVRAALQGASLVIYMGHGNGWPSRYRDSLYPPTQNGFGLNPVAGGGDDTHQYFGEQRIADSVALATNAVVLLNHLCYASGNSEPGIAEGTLAQARQRVDNFAAGFIKAGAAAVIAEAYASPNHMVKAVLGGGRSIDAAWRGAPSRNGRAFAFESQRSPGYVAQMDPERADSGFTRSIVLKAGLAPDDVLRNARGSNAPRPAQADPSARVPSLLRAGITVQEPFIDSSTAAGATLKFKFRYTVADRGDLPSDIQASARWDALDPVATDPTSEVAPGPDPAAPDPAAPTADTPPDSGPPDLGLVTPERLGDVIEPVDMKVAKTAMAFGLAAPSAPGRYRLTVTLHDKHGVAFDAATQALLPSLIVRVTGDLDAQIVAPSRSEVAPGASTPLDLWVANLGKRAWGHHAIDDTKDPESFAPATAARVIGQWVALGDVDAATLAAAAAATASAELPAGLQPGAVVPAGLAIAAPTIEGDYLLVLDIVTPEDGSIVAAGLAPTIIRVTVRTPAPAPVAPAAPVSTVTPEAPDEAAAPVAPADVLVESAPIP